MPDVTLLVVLVVFSALAFDYINGFHDTANAIATVVSTRVLSPQTAIVMAALLNFLGALASTHVAITVASGLIDTARFRPADVRQPEIFAAKLQNPGEPLSLYLARQLSPATRQMLAQNGSASPLPQELQAGIAQDLNRVLQRSDLYTATRFAHVALNRQTVDRALASRKLKKEELAGNNRLLLEKAYPPHLAPGRNTFQVVILAAIVGAIVWNLITWRFGIPSSSSHALIGGLCGAAIIHGGLSIVFWQGIVHKVLLPLVGSPAMGFVLGYGIMTVIFKTLAHVHPGRVSASFRVMQIFSAAAMAFTHGLNDAQKSMGIITMALLSAQILAEPVVPRWVVFSCAAAMALGTSAGGWRIIKTMGHKIIRLEPVHGFAAETASAFVLFVTSHFGMPVSTTHVISGSIFGVGSSKRLSAVRWSIARSMVMAWVLTLPAAGLVAAFSYELFLLMGLGG